MVKTHDDLLWRKARLGDTEAFGLLFERHAGNIYGYCFRRTGDWALAEDLTSVTFLEAWRRRDVDLLPGKVTAWLFGIATNVLRGQRRALRRYAAALKRFPDIESEHDFAADVVNRIDAERKMHDVLSVISELPAREQEVVALIAWQGLSQIDVAFALGVPAATVRTRLLRARVRLRKRLDVSHSPSLDFTLDEMETNRASGDA
jgi:RNA polymerase sigma factor (sigma-70 family)